MREKSSVAQVLPGEESTPRKPRPCAVQGDLHGEVELPRSRGRSHYAAIFSIFSLMNFNSNSIGLT
jgi:hypothetical protein